MAIPDTAYLDAQTKAKKLETADASRLEVFDAVDQIYFMSDEALPNKEEWFRKTFSPDGHNAEDGAVRLLTGSDPAFRVPMETNDPKIRKIASDLEQAAMTIWKQAGKVAGRPRHYDPIRSGVHYDEVHIVVRSTKAMVDEVKGKKGGKGSILHAERVNAMTPVLFDCINPRDGHCEWSSTGLTAYYSKQKFTVAEIRSRFGDEILPGQDNQKAVNMHDFWSLDYHFVWVDGQTEALVMDENDLGMIPVAAVICEGSFFFNQDGQDTRRPLLYTIHKSNIWKRQNLLLSVSTSLVFLIASYPALVHTSPTAGADLVIDRTEPGGVVHLGPGEDLRPLLEKVLDPSFDTMKGEFSQLAQESTMYKTAIGQGMGANAPYSMVSLLNQVGRLPLISYQRIISMAITQAMHIAFAIIKRDGASLKAKSENGLMTIESKKIPDYFDMEAVLEIDQAQDDRLNAQVASQLVERDLASVRYVQEKFLKIDQPDRMSEEIQEEKFVRAMAEMKLKQEIQKMQAQAQQAQPQPGQPQQPQPQPSPDMQAMRGLPQEPPMSPETQGVQPGLPMAGPAEAMGSPMGPGGMPPEMQGGM